MNRLLFLSFLVPLVLFADSNTPMRSLPENTVAALRIPNGRAFFRELQNDTKLGKVALNSARIERALELFKQDSEGDWEEFSEILTALELQLADLPHLAAGDMGYSVILAGLEDKEPRVYGLAWLTPTPTYREKFIKALENLVEQQVSNEDEEEKQRLKRVDTKLGDQPVMHLVRPDIRFIYEDGEYSEQADSQHDILINTTQESILILHSMKASQDGAEEAMALFAQILTTSNGEGEFANRMQATPGMTERFAQNENAMELFADARPLRQWAEKRKAEDENVEKVLSILEQLGLADITAAAMSIGLDDNILRSEFTLSAPATRTGLLALLDTRTAPEVAPWIPVSVAQYSHLELDLAQLWSLVREVILAHSEEKAKAPLLQIERTVQATCQASLVEVLAALGSRFIALEFGPDVNQTEADAEIEDVDMERQAIIWELEDEAVWKRVMAALAMFAAQPGGAFTPTEEQGFTGYRMSEATGKDGALIIGEGYLALCIGRGVTQIVLNHLRTLPEGENAIVNTQKYRQLQDLLKPEAGMTYQYTNASLLLRQFSQAFGHMIGLQLDSEEMPEWLDVLIPEQKDLEGALSVGGQYGVTDDQGISVRSVLELPAE